MSGVATGRRIDVRGIVQGVGFRPWVYRLARRLGVTGSVQNGPAGVTILAFAAAPVLDELCACLSREAPTAARIDALGWEPLADAAGAPAGFEIIASAPAGSAARASIPADLAMCDACAQEIHDPVARRFRYPFTNCTHCGPRFSIATAVPYDRANTTMREFALCADCRREYEDPADRRFHAQPIACPRCGPRLEWRDAAGAPVATADPLFAAALALAEGGIVAVRGLGGFHLACDAGRDEVVAELRRRKRRDEKPLAVMVADLAAAHALAHLDAAEAALLAAPSRPIVVVERRAGAALAAEVAPGARTVGLFLPYTPLHQLLLEAVGRPLVMTSGNRSDEPMAVENDEALGRLAGIADGFLVHDRPIATRTDDSVARVVDGAPLLLRRARGHVPDPLRSPVRFDKPVLALGGQLKNSFCIGAGDLATLGPHVGDLDDLGTYESYGQMIARFERFLGVSPAVLAHDLHPDYRSTLHATERPATTRIAVQHHHAHVAAVMAEHGLAGPVLGVAYDGTGYGADGSAWGGELLLAGYRSFERLATFRPLALAGGERAILAPWRLALAALDDAFAGDAPLTRLALFDEAHVAAREVAQVRALVASGAATVPAHGVGRFFDAAAALVLARPRARFEAQLAMALEDAAAPAGSDDAAAPPYPFALDVEAAPWQIDLRPMWRALVGEHVAGGAPARLAARFHATIAAATVHVVHAARARRGDLPVVLAGGCFQNARLARLVLAGLRGVPTYLPRRVPPGDGGLALGQAVVAAACLAGSSGRQGAS